MANSVDPDQTAPIEAVCSGSTLFASILSNVRQLFAADDIFKLVNKKSNKSPSMANGLIRILRLHKK